MQYHKTITLKNGGACCLRSGTEQDAQAILNNIALTHGETDYLLSYPEESSSDCLQEAQLIRQILESENEVELIALVEGAIVGTASIKAVGTKYKVRHRARFGVSISKSFWGLGIGQALMASCIECAQAAGYVQLELEVVADNLRALSLYQKAGFVEYGRNPKGFYSRAAGFQEMISMRLEL